MCWLIVRISKEMWSDPQQWATGEQEGPSGHGTGAAGGAASACCCAERNAGHAGRGTVSHSRNPELWVLRSPCCLHLTCCTHCYVLALSSAPGPEKICTRFVAMFALQSCGDSSLMKTKTKATNLIS